MIAIYGDNDDCVIVESDTKTEEILLETHRQYVTIRIEDKLEIDCEYVGPCWSFTVTPVKEDEDRELFTITISADTDISQILEVECPEGTEWEYEVCY